MRGSPQAQRSDPPNSENTEPRERHVAIDAVASPASNLRKRRRRPAPTSDGERSATIQNQLKLEPQPQVRDAFGLSMLKPVCWRPSL